MNAGTFMAAVHLKGVLPHRQLSVDNSTVDIDIVRWINVPKQTSNSINQYRSAAAKQAEPKPDVTGRTS